MFLGGVGGRDVVVADDSVAGCLMLVGVRFQLGSLLIDLLFLFLKMMSNTFTCSAWVLSMPIEYPRGGP